MSFVNKVVLVTGGSSGIGASAALAFTREGADVCIVGRNESRLAAVSAQCAAVGKTPLAITADLSRDEDVANIVSKVIDRHGKLDVLINNAGIVKLSNIGDENFVSAYDEVLNTNLRAVVMLTNSASKYLKLSKGNIINVSSVAGKSTLASFGFTGYAAYCVSKAALDHFSKICAMELAEFGVRVNVISPGPVETPILNTVNEKVDVEVYKNLTALHMMTQPEEVADLMIYLASDKAKSITGGDYLIDAGALVRIAKK